MSRSLNWRPAPLEPEGRRLPYGLLAALLKRWERDFTDVTIGEKLPFDRNHIPYLEGLRDGGVDGAAELIAAIEKHDVVEIWMST